MRRSLISCMPSMRSRSGTGGGCELADVNEPLGELAPDPMKHPFGRRECDSVCPLTRAGVCEAHTGMMALVTLGKWAVRLIIVLLIGYISVISILYTKMTSIREELTERTS